MTQITIIGLSVVLIAAVFALHLLSRKPKN